MASSLDQTYHYNWHEEDEKLLAQTREQYIKLKADPSIKPWPVDVQKKLVTNYIEHVAGNDLTRRGEAELHLATVFPNTKWGIAFNFRALTSWLGVLTQDFLVDRSDEAKKLIERAKAPAEELCLRLRAPGSMLFPLVKPRGAPWEALVTDTLTKPDAFNTDDLVELGRVIADNYGIEKEDIARECSFESDAYIFTYHYEPLDPTKGYQGHCCGAHAHDTHRGMMGAIAEAALFTWATNGSKEVTIQGRRTAIPGRNADLIDPSKMKYKEFIADFFVGDPPNDAEQKLQADGRLFPPGVERPVLEWAFNAMRDINKLRSGEKKRKIAVISCSDDRLGLRIRKDGTLQVSQVPEHTSNIMYVSVGRRALSIVNKLEEAPGVYRDTIANGERDIFIGNMPAIESQIMTDVPLILRNVMSSSEPHKQMFIDIVVGAEAADWFDATTKKIADQNTYNILMSPAIRRDALPALAAQTPPIQFAPGEFDRAVVENTLPKKVVEAFIQVHEQKVFDMIDRILRDKLYDALKVELEKRTNGKGQSIGLNFRIIRVADNSIGYRSLGRDEVREMWSGELRFTN